MLVITDSVGGLVRVISGARGNSATAGDVWAAKYQSLLAYVLEGDWHGVRDVAVELEILDALAPDGD